MRLTDHSPIRPRARFELKRRCFHRGYLWPWILVIVVPLFLRLVMFYDITFLFQLSPSTAVLTREELQLYSRPRDNLESTPITIDDVNFRDMHDSLVIRPDEDSSIIHDEWISHATDSLKNERFQKSTEVERSTGRHLPVTKIPSDQDIDTLNLKFHQGNDEDNPDVGDEGKVREIENTKNLVGQQENAEKIKKSTWTDEDDRRANEEKKAAEETEEWTREEMEAADEDMRIAGDSEASDKRKFVEGRGEASEKRIGTEEQLTNLDGIGENMRADEERRIAKQLEAAPEGIAGVELEVAAGEKAVEERESEDERKANAQGNKADVDGGNAEKRKTEEEMMILKEREADEEKKRLEEEREGNSDEVKEQKTADGQKESESAANVEEATQETTHSDDQNQREKEEALYEDSDPKYREDFTITGDQTQGASSAGGECDLFDGDWEWDPEGPMYTNSTCFYIQGDHNCMSNGRQDTGFQSWRWKPRGCDLPRFDARTFLEAFKGKTIGFVGDSLARNQMQSMLCLLSMVEIPIKIYDDPLSIRWLYKLHEVTLVAVWSPYLLKESQAGIMGFEKGQSVLYLDVLDPLWTSMLPDFEMIVLSVGQWYMKPSVYVAQDEVVGCHYCPNLNLTELGFAERYSEGLQLALEKLAADWKGIAILSTFATAHSERVKEGEYEQCRRERPLEQEEYKSSFLGMHKEMRDIVWGEFSRMVNQESKANNDVHVEFLDVSNLSALRADGHPGPFVFANPFEGKSPEELVYNDCLHWCLPGPVDTWNQLLVTIAQKHL